MASEAGPSSPRSSSGSSSFISKRNGSSSAPEASSASHDKAPAALFAPILAGRMPSRDELDDWVAEHRTIVTAGTASLVSTMASFPFDSLKSRLQVKYYPSIWACGRAVLEEEGIAGFFRGVTIPLITITFVRTSSFSIYYNTKHALHAHGYVADSAKLSNVALSGAAGGFTSGLVISCGSAPFELVKVQRQLEYLIAVQKGLVGNARSTTNRASTSTSASSARSIEARTGSEAGSGSRTAPLSSSHASSSGSRLHSIPSGPSSSSGNASSPSSTRSFSSPATLTSVAQAASSSGAPPSPAPTRYVPQSGFAAAREIMTNHGGFRGFYIGFRLHFLRDTSGTAIYFGLYDTLREIVRRQTGMQSADAGGRSSRSGSGSTRIASSTDADASYPSSGPRPRIFGMPAPPMPVLQFLTGSTAGILSWLAVYWLDFLKTNVQQRRLAGADARLGAWQVLTEEKELGVLSRIARLYRGIGISAVRSFISHGLTWTLIEQISERIDARERARHGSQGGTGHLSPSTAAATAPSLPANDASSSPASGTPSRPSRWL